MNINKNWIIFILVAIIATIFLFKCNGKLVPKPETIRTKVQVEDVKKKESEILPNIDSLKYRIQILESDNYNKDINLKISQQRTRELANKIKVIHDTIPAINDNNYYTKEQVINDLIASSEKSDSICNDNIGNLNEQIVDYKKADSLKGQLYFSLRQSFDKSIEQQNILQGYSKKLETKIKWTRAGKFLWKGAAIIAGLFILKTALK